MDAEGKPVATARPEYKRLEAKIKSQANRLRYHLAFVDAYEAEGWRNSSREKIKPNQELEVTRRKIAQGQRAILDALHELQGQNASDPQIEAAVMLAEVHCSRCGSTETDEDNDILVCDSLGCLRAYHQKCQTPWVKTAEIPKGEELWYCEVCLAVFECLKSINSAFGTTYELVKDLFPELTTEAEQTKRDASGEASRATDVQDPDDDEDDDEDFVCDEAEDEDEEAESSDDSGDEAQHQQAAVDAGDGVEGEVVCEEVPVTEQELQFLSKADVIDPNRRSMRSQSAAEARKVKPKFGQPSVVGELAAKLNPATGELVLGVVVELQPPAPGRYSRWRVDYRDETTEFLTRKKVELAVRRAAETCGDGTGAGGEATVVQGKRKRTEVDYCKLNDMMFDGQDDEEEDETFEAKDANDDEEDDEEDDEDDEEDDEDGEDCEDAADDVVATEGGDKVPAQPSPTTVTAGPNAAPAAPSETHSQQEGVTVDYGSLHEGVFTP